MVVSERSLVNGGGPAETHCGVASSYGDGGARGVGTRWYGYGVDGADPSGYPWYGSGPSIP